MSALRTVIALTLGACIVPAAYFFVQPVVYNLPLRSVLGLAAEPTSEAEAVFALYALFFAEVGVAFLAAGLAAAVAVALIAPRRPVLHGAVAALIGGYPLLLKVMPFVYARPSQLSLVALIGVVSMQVAIVAGGCWAIERLTTR